MASLIPVRRSDYVHTFVLEMVVLTAQILAFKLAAEYWGELGFSEYALTRRAVSLIQPALMLGLAVALPRFAARAIGAMEGSASGYLHAGLLLVGGALVMWLGFLLSWDRLTALVLYGDESYAYLISAIALVLVGLSAHVVAYGYMRGKLWLRWANWLQVCNVGLAPVTLFLVPDLSVERFFTLLGATWAAIGGSALIILVVVGRRVEGALRTHASALVRYGAPRVPGEFLQVALLGVPAVVVAHLEGVEAAGYVAFAMSLLSMLGSLFSPIGLVLLPAASRLVSLGERARLARHVRHLVILVTATAIVLVASAELGAEVFIRAYLGDGFVEAVPIVRLVLLGAVPYALYMVLRSVLDALHERALNTKNLSLAGVAGGLIGAAALAMSQGVAGVLVAVTAAFCVLGGLTLRDALRSFPSLAA